MPVPQRAAESQRFLGSYASRKHHRNLRPSAREVDAPANRPPSVREGTIPRGRIGRSAFPEGRNMSHAASERPLPGSGELVNEVLERTFAPNSVPAPRVGSPWCAGVCAGGGDGLPPLPTVPRKKQRLHKRQALGDWSLLDVGRRRRLPEVVIRVCVRNFPVARDRPAQRRGPEPLAPVMCSRHPSTPAT
jgi:hypothetical protein